ncbi:MAG: Fe-S cluster protein [Desulfobacteraceae bacterium]|nr:Fe-S cluster protein [Desulfobacteraceae bacterium]
MLLQAYRLEIFNNECMPGAVSVQCFAHLDRDVGKALPFLNAVLGGFEYIKDPPSVTFRTHGKLITVHGRKIAVNALKDEAEARKIVEWLKNEINDAWENRTGITPRYEGMPRPVIFEILKLLPRTNCRECGAQTCMVFATQTAEGARSASDCPLISPGNRLLLDEYMSRFNLEV